MASLRVKNGPSAGREIEVEGDLIIGREASDLTIEDPKVSRRHAIVRVVPGAIEVEDLGSSNGTFVGGSRIDGPTRVNGGGQIRCGTTMIEVFGVLPAQETRISGAAAPGTTDDAPIPDSQVTRLGSIQREADRQAPTGPAAPAPGGQAVKPAPPIGSFRPPVRRRRRGLASRSWVPTVLSFGTVIVVAVALVVYFAAR